MKIFDLVNKEAAGQKASIFASATLAGGSNVLILFLANLSAEDPGKPEPAIFIAFLLSIALFALCSRYTHHQLTEILERGLHNIKIRITGKIAQTDLQGLEQLGTAEIYDRITENVTTVSASAGIIANFLQSICVVVLASIYLALLSGTAFVLLMLVVGACTIYYTSKSAELKGYQQQLAQTRLAFFDRLTDMVKGFREIKYNRRRSSDLQADLIQTSDSLRQVTVQSNRLFDNNWIFANCSIYFSLGAIIFFLPLYTPTDVGLLGKLISGTLFIWGPLGNTVAGFPMYIRSNHALSEIAALEQKLDELTRDVVKPEDAYDPWSGVFTQIEACRLCYEYKSQSGDEVFHIGPLDLTIKAGDITFIVGGNGSGKSTFLKALTGLYAPTSGSVRVNGLVVTQSNVAAYREMFSAIYTDFHLFSKFYGLLDVEDAAVNKLIAQMQIEGKTAFADQRFTKRDLSTGQRKRLAMIVTLLEDRPIFIFDEWAADQDPEFREYFYTELLPSLKQRGKTIIAVSHDDRYFRYADQVVTMEFGQIRSIQTPGASSVVAPPSSA